MLVDWYPIAKAPRNGEAVWVIDMKAAKPAPVLARWHQRKFRYDFAWELLGTYKGTISPTHFTEVQMPAYTPTKH